MMRGDNFSAWFRALAADVRTRRTLPVLIVLLLAAVIIPVALSHSGHASPVAALPPTPPVTSTVPAVSVSTTRHEPSQDYLTGPAHDPFVSHTATTGAGSTSGAQQLASAAKTTAATPHTTASAASGAGATGSAATSHVNASTTSSSVAPTGTVPVRTTTVSHTTTVTTATPYVDFKAEMSLLQTGVGGPPTVFHNLARDQLLASDQQPFAAFLGVRTDGRTAVLLMSDQVQVSGSGRCAPSLAQCTFLELSPGTRATVVVNAGSGAVWTFTLRYLKVSKVDTSQSVVSVDPNGAADVKAAAKTISQLRTVHYEKHSGLLEIRLGSSAPVVH